MNYNLLLPPVAGAVIGWFTNYVAIKLLFRPHLPVKVFGCRIQGLIPKRRRDIARSLARAIEKELLSIEDLSSALGSIDWKKEVEKTVEGVVEHRFSRRVKSIPVVGLVSENLKYHIKYIVTKEILTQIEKKKGDLAARFRENLNLRELVASRIDGLDLHRVERALTDFISGELRRLEWLGGIIGFAVGLAESGILYMLT